MENHFVGIVEKEINGYLHIEGYLFDTPGEAKEFMEGKLKRCVNRILKLTLGKFEGIETRSSH